ncbi:galactose mutarotase [Prochlorococcus sp. MIT 1307]|uniref:aldose epimerase family protein n=1 Tax=Prochlorococcus sp. MIT 1307 TaxID=3096219 RepID=UPI002A760C95|nr:galactose mutarotase [Prochlorococcus sp. MIT 1307]
MPITFTRKEVPYHHWELLDIDSCDRIRIVPERGGLITEWFCNGREVLYFDYERFNQIGQSVRGGIPILFPICGNLPGNSWKSGNHEYRLPQHGFSRDLPWKIDFMHHDKCCVLSLCDNEASRAMYPYSFLVEIKFKLEINAINFLINIENRSKEKMPFSFGMHPYFNVTDLGKIEVDGLPSKCINHLNMLEDDTKKQLAVISDGIDFICGPSKLVTVVDLLTRTRVHLQQQEPMNLTVLWTDPPRKMICLEPWTSPRESLINGERILLLEPGAIQKLDCRLMTD